MYLASIVLLLLVIPAASVAIETMFFGGSLVASLAKWFVFWPVGVRLFMAGIKQTLQPQFTAEGIFGIKDPSAQGLVREIGFGNLSIGALGLLSLLRPDFLLPAAIVGGLYYGLAGLGHVTGGEGNAKKRIAMVSDLLIFVVLVFVVIRIW
jgi:hypothetical protein